jgi:DNA-binding response OmpR family regulator
MDTPEASQRYECDVVIVEDFKDLADSTAEALRRTGLSVLVALDGRSALAIADRCTARVALIDCNLPDFEGLDLVPRLRARWPEAEFIMVSGNVAGVPESLARSSGIRLFLNKPVPLRALCQAVHRLVRQPAPPGRAASWISLGIGSPRDDKGSMPLAPAG